MKDITPFLWFDTQAKEAADYYVSLFPDAEILDTSYYGSDTPGETGSVMTVSFRLRNLTFTALNGGPLYEFTPALSFAVDCETQDEIDRLWEKLGEGGVTMPCGWVSDKFGVTWQIVPSILMELMGDEDEEKANRVTQAMLKMGKLDIQGLKDAYDGKVIPE
jgi:predicted 3-demethylubiquinone-9 3-methyltransferase (glyoxalase superfamily)